ncbi:MAG: hypothetical protein NC489_36595 [Ruminococcus flavefaciens]|nr:hypothetical protein [Ruminococcus flavefaciens]
MMRAQQNRKRKHTLSWVLLIPVCVAVFVAWSFFWWFGIAKPALTSPPEATPEEKKEQRMQEVLAYLEERYGEEFEIASYRGMSYVHDYVQMYAYPKGFSDEAHQFQIQGRLDEDGNMEYTDSYVMVKLTDEYEAYVDPIIGEYFDEYKFYVRFQSEWLTGGNLAPDTKLEDLWELHANEDYPLPRIDIYAYNAEKDRPHLENMVKEFSVKNVRGVVHLVYSYDGERYQALTDNWNDNIIPSDYDNIISYLIYADNYYECFD